MVKNLELADLLGGAMTYQNDPPTADDILNDIMYQIEMQNKAIYELFGFIEKHSEMMDCFREWVHELEKDIEDLKRLYTDEIQSQHSSLIEH